MSEIKAFTMKVQGTFNYAAELRVEAAHRVASAEALRVASKQHTDAAWRRFIEENQAH